MGTPNKTSSLFVLNGLDVYPSLYGSSPLMSNRIISLRWILTSFALPVHNQGASLAIHQGHTLRRKFLPATSSFFVLSLLIQALRLQHLSADVSCNHYDLLYFSVIQPLATLPDVGYLKKEQIANTIILELQKIALPRTDT